MKKTRFRPHAIYPDDKEFDKNYLKKQHIYNLYDKIVFSKQFYENRIDGIKQMISSIEDDIIKKEIKENPSITYDELENEVFNYINNELVKCISPTKNNLYLLKTIDSALNNPDIITTIISTQDMKEYLNSTSDLYEYTSNINANYKTLIKDAFSNISDVLTDDLKKKMLNHTLSYQDKAFIQNEVCKYIKKYYDSTYDITIKNRYGKRLAICATVIDHCGLLPKNNTVNNFRLSYLGLDFLGYDYYENNSDTSIKRPYLSSIMDENFVKSFSTDELIALSAFYSNRLAKYSTEYNDVLYLLYKTDALHKYYNDPSYKFDLPDDEISTILAQHKLFINSSREYLDLQVKKHKDNISENFFYEDINTPIISSTLHKLANYEVEFEKLLPNYQHDLIQDFVKSIDLQLTVNNAYNMKKHALESLLLMIIDNNNNDMNWGVILEKIDAKYDKDPNNNFLIGIDMKGFNMPLKLHCEESQIREFLTNYTGRPIIPVYKGNDDFLIDNTYYSTQVLYKLSNDQRKLLHEKSEEIQPDEKNYKMVHHIEWLSNPSVKPEFIKNEKQYYDMNTGKVLSEKDIDK